ncbi:MAG: GNAT family N-acetyltransferase [Tagaea sp.]|nr:GNAT family N-acetyltransferase [Tagaea sp.]
MTAPLAPGDAARLAALHAQALPRSLVALLGRAYARAFYGFCAASGHEKLLAARDGAGAIQAACLVSARPGDLGARLRSATPLLSAAVAHPRAWLDLSRAAIAVDAASPEPEIVLLFADEAARGRGLGKALVEEAARDTARLAVVTEDDPANRAIAFYRKLGFVDSGPVSRNGKKFRRLAR